jgi:hypothetical protein
MFVRRFVGAALVMLLVVGLLAAGGAMGFRIGWSQSAMAQQMRAEGAEGGAMPLLLPGSGHVPGSFGWGPILGVFGLLLVVILFAMMIGVAAKMFAFHAWQTAGGPGPEFWSRRWHKAHGHGSVRPWCWDWEKPSGPEVEKKKADASPGGIDSDEQG